MSAPLVEHRKDKSGSFILLGAVVLTVLLAIGQGKRLMAKYSETSTKAVAVRVIADSPAPAIKCPSVSTDWKPADVPASTGDWPGVVEIPPCHRIVWCVPDEHNVCKEREVAGYDEQCRIGTTMRPWEPEACRIGNGSRIRSRSEMPIKGAAYRFEFIG
jgi:hypothetical protein